MTHFYEKNIVEIKNEYTTFLVNIVTPLLYEGVKSIYNYSQDTHKKLQEKSKDDPRIVSPGPLKIFQTCLKELPTLNNYTIERETNRIKETSRCSEWFDDLVRAAIKSNIVLLTFCADHKQSDVVNQKFHERIEIKDFIHKCYIESARSIYNNPELFWHEFDPIEIKRNQREACELIKIGIKDAIRKMLPIKLILMEYLNNDYVNENMSNSQYENVKDMVQADINSNNEDTEKNLMDQIEDKLTDDNENSVEKNVIEQIESKLTEDNDYSVNGFEEYDDREGQNDNATSDYLNSLHKKLTNIESKARTSEGNSSAQNVLGQSYNIPSHQSQQIQQPQQQQQPQQPQQIQQLQQLPQQNVTYQGQIGQMGPSGQQQRESFFARYGK